MASAGVGATNSMSQDSVGCNHANASSGALSETNSVETVHSVFFVASTSFAQFVSSGIAAAYASGDWNATAEICLLPASNC